MVLAFVIVLFIVVPVAELWFILQLAEWLGGGFTGAFLTIALLVFDSIVGVMLLRSQGFAAWNRFLQAISERRVPHREVVDGMFVVTGGALLLTPGFLTDFVGLAMLLPPSRRVFSGFVTGRISKRVMRAAGVEGFQWRGRTQSGAADVPPEPVVDEEVLDVTAVEEEIDFQFRQKRLEGR